MKKGDFVMIRNVGLSIDPAINDKIGEIIEVQNCATAKIDGKVYIVSIKGKSHPLYYNEITPIPSPHIHG